MNLYEELRAQQEAHSISSSDLLILEGLDSVRMHVTQKTPADYVEAYGSVVKSCAHEIGYALLVTFPFLTVETVLDALETKEGPHKDEVLQALDYIAQQRALDEEAFNLWVKIDATDFLKG